MKNIDDKQFEGILRIIGILFCFQGYPKDLKRAFELYKACGLPYAHYRCGEFYEKGWGTDVNLEQAKVYYRLAYKEKHPLAIRKLKEWNFLE